MKKTSAGLVVYRTKNAQLEVLIAHMGTPWWAKKDKGAWSIPKGEYINEEPLAAAKREFKEELGLEVPGGKLIDLGEISQKNNKTVKAWAVEADLDVSKTVSNSVSIEWPPRSGKIMEYPEIDRAAYFDLTQASQKLVPGQVELLNRLANKLGVDAKIQAPEQSSLFDSH